MSAFVGKKKGFKQAVFVKIFENSSIERIGFITNDDLAKVMDTSDEWISTRTGIKKRHTVGKTGLGPSDLAVKATTQLLDKIGEDKEIIDYVVFATSTPEYAVPGSGSVFQQKMGLDNIGVLDIRRF